MEFPKQPVAHGVRGKTGEFYVAVREGPQLETLSRLHELSPSLYSEKRAVTLSRRYGADRLLLADFGWDLFACSLYISKASGLDWVAGAFEDNLRTAGYQPKRVSSVTSDTKAGMQVMFLEYFTPVFAAGMSTQVRARVTLKVRLIKDGREIKSAEIVGQAQEGTVFAHPGHHLGRQMAYALDDALMQVFKMIRDSDL